MQTRSVISMGTAGVELAWQFIVGSRLHKDRQPQAVILSQANPMYSIVRVCERENARYRHSVLSSLLYLLTSLLLPTVSFITAQDRRVSEERFYQKCVSIAGPVVEKWTQLLHIAIVQLQLSHRPDNGHVSTFAFGSYIRLAMASLLQPLRYFRKQVCQTSEEETNDDKTMLRHLQ
jgi:hypothetical protein